MNGLPRSDRGQAPVAALLASLVTPLVALPRRVLQVPVHAYRLLLKPWLGNACRFEPTCSAYALQALEQHGALRGSVLSGWRILRCNPWCDGGCDPVPAPHTGLFTRLVPPPAAAGAVPGSRVDALSPSPSGADNGASPVTRP